MIFSVGAPADPAYRSLIMGASFGIALTLVVFAGSELFTRDVLCNWLVCLALWMSARMNSDAAKCIAIFWCLFAFIAAGFEHSVANMTLFSVALLGDPPAAVNIVSMAHNLLWVSIGNIVAGAGLMGLGYAGASRRPNRSS